jgi:hypothetical protein
MALRPPHCKDPGRIAPVRYCHNDPIDFTDPMGLDSDTHDFATIASRLLEGKVLETGGTICVRFERGATSELRFNLVDDEGLSVAFNEVDLAGSDTVMLKDVNGTITAEIE